MPALPTSVVDPVADAIYGYYVAKYGNEPARGYLGASALGKPCSRALWYGFRWAKPANFPGRIHRLFQTGHLQEPRVVADLRGIGCVVEEVDPQTGRQWSFSEESTGHHLAGNLDGKVSGVPGAPKTKHVLEIKTSSEKQFRVMQKDGVQKAKPEHYAQMQLYMHWSKCVCALYVVVNKDTDEIYTERVKYVHDTAHALIDKAMAIIQADTPPAKISEDATWFECKFCDYHAMCHGQEVPAVTCRSCAHSTPVPTGNAAWTCGRYGCEIPPEGQREGCDGHRYIPILLERCAKAVDFKDDAVVYEMANGAQFTNGDPDEFGEYISSREIHAVADKAALTDPRVVSLRKQLNEQFPGGRLVA